MSTKPYADTQLARLLSRRIPELWPLKSQAEIAEQAGFDQPNMMTLLKQGAIRLPLRRVLPMARALDVDPGHLLRLAVEQAVGASAGRIFEHLTPLSRNERAWLDGIRDASDDTDPPLTAHALTTIHKLLHR